MTRADFELRDEGSLMLLQPLTAEAREWAAEHLPADALRWAGAVVLEPRYVAGIVAGIINDGLEVHR